MKFITLDMEGVLVPEIWIEFAKIVGRDEFRITTKEEPDYNKLMKYRIEKLREFKLGFADVSKALNAIEPYEGAREFLAELNKIGTYAILSDTFSQFYHSGIDKKLGNSLVFCHELVIENGYITDFKIRIRDQKRKTVEALKTLNYRVFSTGDSYNDISMIRSADDGALFRSPEKIKKENPDLKTFEKYSELLKAIQEFN